MYGDSAHKKLLDNGWSWYGSYYTKDVQVHGVVVRHGKATSREDIDFTLQLRPVEEPHSAIETIRRGAWAFMIGDHVQSSHSNFTVAARAVLGDIIG